MKSTIGADEAAVLHCRDCDSGAHPGSDAKQERKFVQVFAIPLKLHSACKQWFDCFRTLNNCLRRDLLAQRLCSWGREKSTTTRSSKRSLQR